MAVNQNSKFEEAEDGTLTKEERAALAPLPLRPRRARQYTNRSEGLAEMEDRGQDAEIRKVTITVCGDGNTGKSLITQRLVSVPGLLRTSTYDPTIEDRYTLMRDVDGQKYQLMITDTAGHQRYRALWDPSSMRKDAILMIYDITRPETLHKLEYFMRLIEAEIDRRYTTNDELPPVLIVVGNKCDLEGRRLVRSWEGLDWARQHGCEFMETSATEMVNVEDLFEALVRNYAQIRKMNDTGGQSLAWQTRLSALRSLPLPGELPHLSKMAKPSQDHFLHQDNETNVARPRLLTPRQRQEFEYLRQNSANPAIGRPNIVSSAELVDERSSAVTSVEVDVLQQPEMRDDGEQMPAQSTESLGQADGNEETEKARAKRMIREETPKQRQERESAKRRKMLTAETKPVTWETAETEENPKTPTVDVAAPVQVPGPCQSPGPSEYEIKTATVARLVAPTQLQNHEHAKKIYVVPRKPSIASTQHAGKDGTRAARSLTPLSTVSPVAQLAPIVPISPISPISRQARNENDSPVSFEWYDPEKMMQITSKLLDHEKSPTPRNRELKSQSYDMLAEKLELLAGSDTDVDNQGNDRNWCSRSSSCSCRKISYDDDDSDTYSIQIGKNQPELDTISDSSFNTDVDDKLLEVGENGSDSCVRLFRCSFKTFTLTAWKEVDLGRDFQSDDGSSFAQGFFDIPNPELATDFESNPELDRALSQTYPESIWCLHAFCGPKVDTQYMEYRGAKQDIRNMKMRLIAATQQPSRHEYIKK